MTEKFGPCQETVLSYSGTLGMIFSEIQTIHQIHTRPETDKLTDQIGFTKGFPRNPEIQTIHRIHAKPETNWLLATSLAYYQSFPTNLLFYNDRPQLPMAKSFATDMLKKCKHFEIFLQVPDESFATHFL